jgi:hypothetical protein
MRRTRWCFVVFALAGCGNSPSGSKVGAVDAGGDGTLARPADAASAVDLVGPADTASDGSPVGREAAAADRAAVDMLAADAAQATPDSAIRELGLDSLDGAARIDVRAADVPADGPAGVPDGGPDRGAPSDRVANLDAVTGLVAVSYSNDPDTIFANPERGFYAMYETYASSYGSLSQSALQSLRTQSGVSLLMREWYLDSFVNADLTQAFLDKVTADFGVIRQAGMKAVLRFAYTPNSTKPYGDASKARVLGHIAQIKPILFANSDVIAVLQAGFIGAWGEWYYTDYFGDNGTISASQWTDRQDVVSALLDALDLQRAIQLRTPAFKQHFYGTAALTSAEAFSGAAKERVGHHNDCFLADATDMGTYTNVAADKAYLAAENLYLPQGGETCAVSTYSVWSNAAQDMANLHWSFLNQDYLPNVLASWGTNIDIAKRKLGYRLSLDSGSYSTSAKTGGEFEATFSIRNDGYAAPFNPRGLNLILRGTATTYVAKLPDDPRRFASGGSTTVSHSFCLPPDIASGSYALLLSLPDPVPALATRPEYAIRLANQGTWEVSTGCNNLNRSLIVGPDSSTASCSADAIPVSVAK